MPDWLRRNRSNRAERWPASTAVRAAARGEPLQHILRAGARSLLAISPVDRAAIWIKPWRDGELAQGFVAEADGGPVPEGWKHLDLAALFPEGGLSSTPVRVDADAEESVSRIGPLRGMRSALWTALSTAQGPAGVALIAWRQARPSGNLAQLRAISDDLAIALQHYRCERLKEGAAEKLRARLRLLRAISRGVAADSILPQIARAARQNLAAAFVLLGLEKTPRIHGGAWEGDPQWVAVIQQEPVLELWRKVLEQGVEQELIAQSIRLPGNDFGAPGPCLRRIIAVPIDVQDRPAGVFLAGLARSEEQDDWSADLEQYVLLAGSALERDAVRNERAGLRESARKMVESSAECLIAVDHCGRICEASRAAEFLVSARRPANGTALEDLFTANSQDAVREWRLELASPRPQTENVDASVPALQAELESGGAIQLHLRCEIVGGAKERLWLLQLAPVESQPHAGRERLATEMAALLDSIESGVLLADERGRIRVASERLGAILGISASRLLRYGDLNRLIEAMGPQFGRPDHTTTRWRDRIQSSAGPAWDELELLRPARKILERFTRPIDGPSGARVGWLEVYRDITGQRLIQAKLLQSEKMAALGQLVSGIAHELNNPLTSIQGYAQLLLARTSTEERNQDICRISQEAARAGGIVKNLLLFSREAKPERRLADLNDVIERTLALRSYELKIENIEVEFDLEPGLPRTLADSAQLQQVILNLVINAEQAVLTTPGEDSQRGRIVLRTRRLPGDRISLEVADNGPGILPEIISRVFDPFFTTKPPGVGTGLGLSIVYGIVHEHGGEITVDSQPGHGAAVRIELPALASPFEAPEEGRSVLVRPGPVPIPSLRTTGMSTRILVVEDEPTVAQLIADVLTDQGHHVHTLLDSREALSRIEQDGYALVICDLKMPHLDGAGLYRALKARGDLTPLLLVTGDTLSPRTLEFLKSSGLPYVAKPFLVDELKDAVRDALATPPENEEVPADAERLRKATRKT